MSTLTDYQEARERLERLANGEGWETYGKAEPPSLPADLRLLLGGPPVTAEEIARVILSVALERCQPSRGDVFGWLDDNIAPFSQAVLALLKGTKP